MKKLIFILAMAVMALTAVSCKETNKFEVTYNVDIIGDAEGDVEVTIPDGRLSLDGTTNLNFHYGNVPVLAQFTYQEAVTCGTPKVKKAARLISEQYLDSFKATSAGGTYYLHIVGVAEAYGVKISIDQTLTNRENY